MNHRSDDPFENIESAQEFLTLLAETILETKLEFEANVHGESSSSSSQRAEVLKVVLYTLRKLEFHTTRSQRTLNDLRTLRGLLFADGEAAHA
jgi:hypothetical protein